MTGRGSPTPARAAVEQASAPRLDTVDYFRGLFALSVMLYHYAGFSGYDGWGTATLLKLGIYGVGAFYIISGISFGYAYRTLTLDRATLLAFAVKRFFRLAPVYWLATALTLLLAWPSIPLWRLARSLLVNLTFAFGVLRPGAYIPGGGWSIGNEVAFYLVFPVAIVTLRRSRWRFAVLLATGWAVAAVYAIRILTPALPLAAQWRWYIRPENQICFFLAGILISWGVGRVTFGRMSTAIGLAALTAAFVALPGSGDPIHMVTGPARLAYALVAVAFCAMGALGRLRLVPRVALSLHWLGRVSYAIYMLHLIVYAAVQGALAAVFDRTAQWVPAVAALPLTLLLADTLYRRLEAPFIRIGKRVAGRIVREGRDEPPGPERTGGCEPGPLELDPVPATRVAVPPFATGLA